MRVLPAASVTVRLVGSTVTPFVSLSVIVPTASASVIDVPALASLSWTRNVSSSSSTASFVVATVKVLIASFAPKLSVCFVVCAV